MHLSNSFFTLHEFDSDVFSEPDDCKCPNCESEFFWDYDYFIDEEGFPDESFNPFWE